MQGIYTWGKRCTRELLRDPLSVGFSLGFPVVLLLLMTAIQKNIPVQLFELTSLTPAIAVFGLSFLSLFSASLIARDRSQALLVRMYTTPLTARDYILGYTLPLLPLGLAQGAICYLLAMVLGLAPSLSILLALVTLIPATLLFIGIGLLCGSLFNDKQVGGLCGALLTNLTAWLSGAWFDLSLVGEGFRAIAYALPFVHAVELGRGALTGANPDLWLNLLVLLGWTVGVLLLAIYAFLQQMQKE